MISALILEKYNLYSLIKEILMENSIFNFTNESAYNLIEACKEECRIKLISINDLNIDRTNKDSIYFNDIEITGTPVKFYNNELKFFVAENITCLLLIEGIYFSDHANADRLSLIIVEDNSNKDLEKLIMDRTL